MINEEILSRISISKDVLNELFYIAKSCDIECIKIFGSRVHGRNHQTSDIDLAVWGGNISLFTVLVDEKTNTLLKYDIVNMENPVQEDLIKVIEKEGVVIYEKS